MRSRVLLSAALVAAMLMPKTAHAHEHLKRSEPSAGARLASSPATLRFWFAEPPELRLTQIILRDSTGRVIPLGSVERDSSDALLVSVHLLEHLRKGTYDVTWRAAGADGHPARGTFRFTVLKTTSDSVAANATTSSTHPRSIDPDTVTFGRTAADPTYVAARALTFVALLLIIGAVAFRFAVLPRAKLADATRRIEDRVAVFGIGAAVLLVVSDLLRLGLQYRLVSDSISASLSVGSLVTSTRWGTAWVLQVSMAALAAIAFLTARRRSTGWVVALVASVSLSATSAMASHASALQAGRTLAIVADSLHVLSAAGWLGSLTTMVLVVLPIVAASSDIERWSNIAALVHAFSPMALAFASVVALTGVISAWLQLGSIPALWTTQYGRTLLVKIGALSGLLATGAYNWLRVRPALGTETATRRLQRSAGIELSVGTLVVCVTAVLVATETPVP